MGIFRLLLALSVVLGHGVGYGWLLPIGGNAAVYCFFIISGFYMALILNERYVGHGATLLFYRNRFLRLMPTYWTVLAIVVLYRICWQPGQLAFLTSPDLTWHERIAGAASNLFIIGLNQPHYANREMGMMSRLIPPAWSLEPEILFYALAPWILIGSSFIRYAALLAIGVLVYFVLPHGWWILFPRFLAFYLFFFLSGALSYWVYTKVRVGIGKVNWIMVSIATAAIVGIGFTFRLSGTNEVISIPLLGIYLATMIMIPFLFSISRRSRWDRYLGDLSYPLYICHYALISIFFQDLRLNVYRSTSSIGMLVACLFVAIALKHLIEDPIERLRERQVQRLHGLTG